MSAIAIDYSVLESTAKFADNVAKKCDEYAEALEKRKNEFDSVTKGYTSNLTQAKYYVEQKISKLRTKSTNYSNYATQVREFSATAKRVDVDVKNKIASNQESFLNAHDELKISERRAAFINWLTDLKNKCPVFNFLADLVNDFAAKVSSVLDNIKYWYECQGGKELVKFVVAIGEAIALIVLAVAAFPASGILAIIAAVGAVLAAIDGIVNVITQGMSMMKAFSGDPLWAKIYDGQDKLSDWLRQTNFGDKSGNKFSLIFSDIYDGVEFLCDAITLGAEGVKTFKNFNFKSKFGFIQNFFSQECGLLNYMKTPKWHEVFVMDEFGKGHVVMQMVTKADGTVETEITLKNAFKTLKAFVLNSPIDCKSEKGIRTILCSNLKIDFCDAFKSTFSLTGLKDTFRYNATYGGTTSVAQFKNTFSFQGIKDTLKYNFTHGSFAGAFCKDLSAEKRVEYFKRGVKEIKGFGKDLNKFRAGFTTVEKLAFGEIHPIKDTWTKVTTHPIKTAWESLKSAGGEFSKIFTEEDHVSKLTKTYKDIKKGASNLWDNSWYKSGSSLGTVH